MWSKNIRMLFYTALLVDITNADVERRGDVGQQRHARAPQPIFLPKPRNHVPHTNQTTSATVITPSKSHVTSTASPISTDDGTELEPSVLIHSPNTPFTRAAGPTEVASHRDGIVGWSNSVTSPTKRPRKTKRPIAPSDDLSTSSTSIKQHHAVSLTITLSSITTMKRYKGAHTATSVKVLSGLGATSTLVEQSTSIQTHSPYGNRTFNPTSGQWVVPMMDPGLSSTTTLLPAQQSTPPFRAQWLARNRTSTATSTYGDSASKARLTSTSVKTEEASLSTTSTEDVLNASLASTSSITQTPYANKASSTSSGNNFTNCAAARRQAWCLPPQATVELDAASHAKHFAATSDAPRTSTGSRTLDSATRSSIERAKDTSSRIDTSIRMTDVPSSTSRHPSVSETSRLASESLPSFELFTLDPGNPGISFSKGGRTATSRTSGTTTTQEIQTSSLEDSSTVTGSFPRVPPVYSIIISVPYNGTGRTNTGGSSTDVNQMPTSTSKTTDTPASERSSSGSISVTGTLTSDRPRATSTSGRSWGINATTINSSFTSDTETTARKGPLSETISLSSRSSTLSAPDPAGGISWGINSTASITSVTSDRILMSPMESTLSDAVPLTSTLSSTEPSPTSWDTRTTANTASVTSDEIFMMPVRSTSDSITLRTTTRSDSPSPTFKSNASATGTATATSKGSSPEDSSSTYTPKAPGNALTRTSQAPSTSATGLAAIPDIPEIPDEREDPLLTKSQTAGVAVGGTACLLVALVAAMIVARRYHQKKASRKSGGNIYPEVAYLYDPPIPRRGNDDDDAESGNGRFMMYGAATVPRRQQLVVPENTPASTNSAYNTPITRRASMASATHQNRGLGRTVSAPERLSNGEGPSDPSTCRHRQVEINPHDQATNPAAEIYPPLSPYDRNTLDLPVITRPRSRSSISSQSSKDSNRVSGGVWWRTPPQVHVDSDHDVLLNVDIRSSTPDSALLVLGPQRPQSKTSASPRRMPLSPLKQAFTQPASTASSKGKAPIRYSPVPENSPAPSFPLPPTPGFKYSPSTANTTPLQTPPQRTMLLLPEHKVWEQIKLDDNDYKLNTTTSANSYANDFNKHHHQSFSSVSTSASSSMFPSPLNVQQSYPASSSSSSSPIITINGKTVPRLVPAHRRPPPLSGHGMTVVGRGKAPVGLGLQVPGLGLSTPLRTEFEEKGKGRQSWGVDEIRRDPMVEEKRKSELAFADPELVGTTF